MISWDYLSFGLFFVLVIGCICALKIKADREWYGEGKNERE